MGCWPRCIPIPVPHFPPWPPHLPQVQGWDTAEVQQRFAEQTRKNSERRPQNWRNPRLDALQGL